MAQGEDDPHPRAASSTGRPAHARPRQPSPRGHGLLLPAPPRLPLPTGPPRALQPAAPSPPARPFATATRKTNPGVPVLTPEALAHASEKPKTVSDRVAAAPIWDADQPAGKLSCLCHHAVLPQDVEGWLKPSTKFCIRPNLVRSHSFSTLACRNVCDL